MNFLYFLPGDKRKDVQSSDLPSPLKETLSGSSLECKPLNKGPDGGQGLFFSPVPSDPEGTQAPTNFEPERQFWEPCGAFWIGGYKDALPGPADLRRQGRAIEGHTVVLADGQEWLMPVVGPFFSRLPRVFRMKEGKPTTEVAARYRELSAESEAFAEWAAGNGTRPWVEIMAFVARCLGLNYHVGLAEVSALGILDTHVSDDAIEIIVGVKDYREQEQAKKAG